MRTVGELLKERRIAKGLTLDQLEKATKIRKKFLEAIEADDYSQLPSISYAKGFVKNYCEYLGLNSTDVLAFFRRQTREAPKASIVLKGMADPLNKPTLRLTPSRYLAAIAAVLILLFLLYFGLQYNKLHAPPFLVVDAPKEKLVTAERRIDVLGRTDTDATVTVNGIGVLVRGDGKFFDQVSLDPGVNKIEVIATSRYGKSSTIVREVGAQAIQ